MPVCGMFTEGKSVRFGVLPNFIILALALWTVSVTIPSMEPTDTILTSGFRLGRLFTVTWRLNFLFPIVTLALMWKLQNVTWGLVAACVLLFSVVVHELAHLVVSRSLGGNMDEIQLWPLGGLAHPYGRGYLTDHARVLLAGPALNLVIALSCMVKLTNGQVYNIVQNLTVRVSDFDSPFVVVVQMMFAANLLLFVVNLIPIVPFDAGILLRTYLADRFSEVESRDLMIRSGLVVGFFGLLFGFVFDHATIVAVSAFLVILHTHENMSWLEMLAEQQEDEEAEAEAEGDLGSPESTDQWSNFESPLIPMSQMDSPVTDDTKDDDETGLLQEEVLDEILVKLHSEGRDSLSELEVTLLEQLSNQIRQRRSSL